MVEIKQNEALDEVNNNIGEVITMHGLKNGYRKGKQLLREFLKEESGIGVLEIILIIVVLIGLVIIFSEQLNTIVQNIFSTINSKIDEVQ